METWQIITMVLAVMAFALVGSITMVKKKGKKFKHEEMDFDMNQLDMLKRINHYRKAYSTMPLIPDMELTAHATARAYEINEQDQAEGRISHEGAPDNFGELLEAGLDGVSENIAKGYRSVESCFEAFRRSDGHNTNQMNPEFQYIGISVYFSNNRWYYVLMFGRDNE